MKKTFSKLFSLIALAMILAGGSLTNTASAQGILGGVLSELFGEGHCHHHTHRYDYDYGYDDDYGYDEFVPQPVYRSNRQPMPIERSSLPPWLLGKWQLVDGRVGGATQYEITADGRFTTINLVTGTAYGTYESGRSVQQATYTANGLQIGNKLFQLSSTTPGTLTLSSNGGSFQLQRVNSNRQPPVNVNLPPINGPIGNLPQVNINGPAINNPRVLSVQRSNRLPNQMAGTWYEVSRDSQGQSVLNRYDLDALGSYEMFQYSISAQNEVDLGSPIAQLSQIASAQQRTLAYQDGQLSLGAGQDFAEGPYTVSLTTDANGQPALSLKNATETRLLTRNP